MERSQARVLNDARQRSAIGVIATEENLDSVIRVAIRAENHGHVVLVAHGGIDLGFLDLNSRNIVPVTMKKGEKDEFSRRILEVTAMGQGFPNLLFHSNPEEHIDYERVDPNPGPDSKYTIPAPTHERATDAEALSVVAIPAYNEADTIGSVVEETRPYADDVLVVDDGSDDQTVSRAREAGATVIEHETNRGYGAALKTMFEEAERKNYEALITIDGDGQHAPGDVPKLLAELEDGTVEIAIGSRFVDDAETDLPLYRWLGLMVINVLTNLSMGVVRSSSWVHDTQSGFRAYSSRAIETLATDGAIGDQMDASTDILFHAHEHDYTISEVGTSIDYAVENASSHNPVSHGYTLVKNILKTVEKERPVTVFGLPGFIITFIGFGLSYVSLSNYLSSGTVSTSVTVISVICIMLGFLACVTAIILHALSIHFQRTAPAKKIETVGTSRSMDRR